MNKQIMGSSGNVMQADLKSHLVKQHPISIKIMVKAESIIGTIIKSLGYIEGNS